VVVAEEDSRMRLVAPREARSALRDQVARIGAWVVERINRLFAGSERFSRRRLTYY
jgi:hypothetical protein